MLGLIVLLSRSSFVRIAGILKKGLYIFIAFKPVALSFMRAFRNAMFQQNNTYVSGIVWISQDTENVRLLS